MPSLEAPKRSMLKSSFPSDLTAVSRERNSGSWTSALKSSRLIGQPLLARPAVWLQPLAKVTSLGLCLRASCSILTAKLAQAYFSSAPLYLNFRLTNNDLSASAAVLSPSWTLMHAAADDQELRDEVYQCPGHSCTPLQITKSCRIEDAMACTGGTAVGLPWSLKQESPW